MNDTVQLQLSIHCIAPASQLRTNFTTPTITFFNRCFQILFMTTTALTVVFVLGQKSIHGDVQWRIKMHTTRNKNENYKVWLKWKFSITSTVETWTDKRVSSFKPPLIHFCKVINF